MHWFRSHRRLLFLERRLRCDHRWQWRERLRHDGTTTTTKPCRKCRVQQFHSHSLPRHFGRMAWLFRREHAVGRFADVYESTRLLQPLLAFARMFGLHYYGLGLVPSQNTKHAWWGRVAWAHRIHTTHTTIATNITAASAPPAFANVSAAEPTAAWADAARVQRHDRLWTQSFVDHQPRHDTGHHHW